MIETLDPVAALLDEVGERNLVTVTKYEAIRPDRFKRAIRRRIEIPSIETQALLPALRAQDVLRSLAGKPPIYLREALRSIGGLYDGRLVAAGYNLRVNSGIDFVYNQLSGTSVAVADTLALSNNTLAVSATDTNATLPWSTAQGTNAAASGTTGEWTALGLARKVATTNTHTAAATTYTLAATWTASGTATGTQKIGLFGGTGKATQGSGVLVLANTFTATDLATNDQITVTWTITI
jgi:hypothetical protein